MFTGSNSGNIETVWELPEAVRLFERLGRFARVIRYDRRDTGVSDPVKDDLTLEAHADDALAVMDAVGARRPVLMSAFDGARSMALLAATRPERVGGLIALAPTARGGGAAAPAHFLDILSGALAEFGNWPDPMIDFYAPEWADDPVRRERFNRYIQTAATPKQAARLLRMSQVSDITNVLPLIQTPTLALCPRDLKLLPVESVREFTDLVPGADFREIPGDAAFPFALDVELTADIVEEFMTGSAPAPPSSRILATVLFTDLVDSTRRAAQSGDRAWAGVLERHLELSRAAVEAHGGETIKSTGDGVLALFPGPAQGVRCADRVISDAREAGLEVRTGLHTGEVERSGDDVAGLAVHLAARIMAMAGAGEILVSRTVRDLVIGSELVFSERGEHELKGIPDRWAIYAVD